MRDLATCMMISTCTCNYLPLLGGGLVDGAAVVGGRVNASVVVEGVVDMTVVGSATVVVVVEDAAEDIIRYRIQNASGFTPV